MEEAIISCRRAVPEDAQAIAALAQQLQIREGDDASTAAVHGFLLYAKPEEVYTQRLSISQYCAVAEREGEIVGFLIAHDRGELEGLGESLRYPKALREYLFSLTYPHWIYIDQIAVHADLQHGGIGQHLYDFLHANAPESVLVACTTHDPIPNEASRNFFTKNNHALLTELQEGEWLCGVYGREV
jgi:predicted GNAT superfamily acetyltransferase